MSAAPVDVAGWLAALGLSVYAQAFKDNDIDGAVLAALTADDLREIGVASVGHRRRILEAAARLRASEPPAIAVAAAAAPAPEAPVAERRHLTVMFCDLMDSTALSTQVDPEDYREFIARYRAVLDEAIRPHHGMSRNISATACWFISAIRRRSSTTPRTRSRRRSPSSARSPPCRHSRGGSRACGSASPPA